MGDSRLAAAEPPRTNLDATAATIVADLAERLADPDRVAAGTAATGRRPWLATSLSEGYPGVALLYAELQHEDPRYRRVAHDYLTRAVAALATAPPVGLYAGPLAVAFATSCVARRPGGERPDPPGRLPTDYQAALAALDRRIAAWVPIRLRPEWRRIEAGRASGTYREYDLFTGATGIGRYLLARGAVADPALTAVLTHLTAVTAPLTLPTGARVPGWWLARPPPAAERLRSGRDDRGSSGMAGTGHADLGLAHGIPGPLAVLALAWRAGARVPGQDRAISRIVRWLLANRDTDPTTGTRYWPAVVTSPWPRPDQAGPLRGRSGWCYGTAGVARAVQLAGLALDRPEWTVAAREAIHGVLSQLEREERIVDAAICHGWAGLLHLARLVELDSGDQLAPGTADALVARIVERYEPGARFGFRAAYPGSGPVDLAGFLNGAASVALALRGYLTDGRPVAGWDAALVVA